MNTGDIVEFYRRKQFKYIKPLGDGGTGDTYLFLDETTGIQFAIKKYSPKDKRYIDDFYYRFVDEIKILFNLAHPNVVRVYNYYLYPENKLGYLQMEYVEGTTIDNYIPDPWGKDWETIFSEAVSAFAYLENNHILHRDIRPANIMISKNEEVKIIDFGFGKMLHDEEGSGNSVMLNWPVTELPEEVALNGIYTHQSEIYFLGKLFYHLLRDELQDFRYTYILDKMMKTNPKERYDSFEDIQRDISLGVLGELDFSKEQKNIYQGFADALIGHITCYIDKYVPLDSTEQTLNFLAALIRNSALEENIQDNRLLIKAFINCGYRYSSIKNIKVFWVTDFYKLMMQLDYKKQRIVMDNIFVRLSSIPVETTNDELPF